MSDILRGGPVVVLGRILPRDPEAIASFILQDPSSATLPAADKATLLGVLSAAGRDLEVATASVRFHQCARYQDAAALLLQNSVHNRSECGLIIGRLGGRPQAEAQIAHSSPKLALILRTMLSRI